MKALAQKVQKIRTSTFQFHKNQHFKDCSKHDQPLVYTCFQQHCPRRFGAVCIDCIKQTHNHKGSSTTMDLRQVVPRLQKYVCSKWDEIDRQNQEIRNGYRKLRDNLQYCVDLFLNLKKGLEGEASIAGLQLWAGIIDQIENWINLKELDPARFLHQLSEFVKKFNMEVASKDGAALKFEKAQAQRLQNLKKEDRRIAKIKKFVDSALLFSSELEQQEFIKSKPVIKPPKIDFNLAKLCTLDQQPKPEQCEGVDQLLVALKDESSQQSAKLGSIIKQYSDLKTLQIRGDKVKLRDRSWHNIVDSFPNLQKLKELKLTLRGEDLATVAKIFSESHTKLRPIDKLHLKVADCKQGLDIHHVLTICNSFQLSGLWLTLVRCQINFTQTKTLVLGLKISTRMTNLSMADLHINLSINKLTTKEAAESQDIFGQRCQPIARKSLQL